MKKIIKKVSKWFREKRKPNLREQCIQAYGEEFSEIYDNLNSGIPVGGFLETALILDMIEAVKKGEPIKLKENENK